MTSATTSNAKIASKILVGVCSARKNKARREGIRRTWLSRPVNGIEVLFFVGDGTGWLDDEPDTLSLLAADTYHALPAKVQAFFTEALRISDFDWLFKCDDDTYVDLSRLPELINDEWDLVGNEFVETRGAPSGGAGYLLRRNVVESLANDRTIPDVGLEDILVGEAAIRHGARPHATNRLCWNTARFPSVWNDTITSHWCSPGRMAEIERQRKVVPRMLKVVHRHWRDTLLLFPDGTFRRLSTNCEGTYKEREENGRIDLDWVGWGPEMLTPDGTGENGETKYTCGRRLSELGIQNYLFDLGFHHGEGLDWLFKVYGIDSSWKVFTFEPNSACHTYLAEAGRKNGVIVTTVPMGAAVAPGLKVFQRDMAPSGTEDGDGSHLTDIGFSLDPKGGGKEIVATIDFSQFLAATVPPKSSQTRTIVKMDIEGAEYHILRKMLKDGTIDLINILHVEFHDRLMPAEDQDSTMELKQALREHVHLIDHW